MLHTRAELSRFLEIEKQLYLDKSLWGRCKQFVVDDPKVRVWKYLKTLRKEGYYHSQSDFLNKLIYVYYHRKRNVLGRRLGLEIWPETFAEGLRIEHAGNIVVNGHARVGRNCILHGSNCIGNSGTASACPVIGDNVRLGVGAKVIGNVTLADDIVVAAGAVVVHSFTERGITVAGVPAKKVKECVKQN